MAAASTVSEKAKLQQSVAIADGEDKENAAAAGNNGESLAQSYTPYSGDWATGDEYWARAMEILKAERKNSIASCASHGSVVAYENQTLIVGFKMKFLCERLQKPDYREVVEEILLRVARVPVRLQCVVDTGGKPVEPNVSASTKKAMEMFKATLHKV